MYWYNGKGVPRCVLCREVIPFLEGSFIGGSTVLCMINVCTKH